ncbi:NAD(P)-binding protein [Leucogyrophana mollusca]|uniref:NAD(P)-binding protein n=1 Tax=Leucogyrophana mollusca TaxID=85980 RepID=A0ACB8BZ77_9AGAM|nr:NAD(P)-binding protein [Leucogyrophana mollusca]
MPPSPFVLISPGSRGLSLALVRHYLRTTDFPVYATHRSGKPDALRDGILAPLAEVERDRLKLIPLDLTSEESIASAAQTLSRSLPKDGEPYLHTGFFTGGVLVPERHPADLDASELQHTFQINVISHLLLIKHFLRFLPTAKQKLELSAPAKWVHVSARVGSISDNKTGGWYSYRASKAALNQVVKTFDLQLQMKKTPAMCVGMHPGTVKTELSQGFWKSVPEEKLFTPEFAAERLANVVAGLEAEQRGRIWDWAGKEVRP